MGISRGIAFLATASVAAGSADPSDLRRARTKVPRDAYRGDDAAAAAASLNGMLLQTRGLQTRECATFDTVELRSILEQLHGKAERELLDIYEKTKDPRARDTASLDAFHAEWEAVQSLANADVDKSLSTIVRDGMCHEAVMWFVHHLSTVSQQAIVQDHDFVLPLLPPRIHKSEPFQLQSSARRVVMDHYEKKVSCQQCHSGTQYIDASLPPPLPVDEKTPGLERLRSCDFQYSPPCGPCEGLGGPRSGDGVHEFEPMHCEIISHPDDVAEKDRVPGVYPAHGTGHIAGDVRFPLVLGPEPGGAYYPEDINVSFGWNGKLARMRYAFNQPDKVKGMKQVYLQTTEQQRAGNSTGVTVTTTADGHCSCDESVAGVLHLRAFAPGDDLDSIALPASKGGLAYLGRVRVSRLDGGDSKVLAVADHYLKYGFHFLVDADEKSATYRLPLRSYIPYGVRQVFDRWDLADPAIAEPDMWKVPAGCEASTAACEEFMEKHEPEAALVV